MIHVGDAALLIGLAFVIDVILALSVFLCASVHSIEEKMNKNRELRLYISKILVIFASFPFSYFFHFVSL